MSDIEEIAKHIAPEHSELYMSSCTEQQWHSDVLHLIDRLTAENERLREIEIELMDKVGNLKSRNAKLERVVKAAIKYSEVAPIGVNGHMLNCSSQKDLLDGGSTDCDCLIGDNIHGFWNTLAGLKEDSDGCNK